VWGSVDEEVEGTIVRSLPSAPMERSRDDDALRPSPEGAAGLLGDDSFGDALARWAAEATVDEAARSRARERWLRIQAEEEASLAGALVDLAERGRPVLLDGGAHRLRGLIVGVGADFVAMRSDAGQQVLVPLGAVEVVRAQPGSEVIGDRSSTLDVTLATVLGPIAADRTEVLVHTDRQAVRGLLRAVGGDVLRVRSDGDPPAPVWVPLAAVRMVVLDPR
jgi:hypothetical protein